MTKVLIGTTNPSKVNRFSKLLVGNDIEVRISFTYQRDTFDA